GVACQKYPAKDPANRLPVLKIKELSTGITDSSDWATSEIDPKYHVVAGDVIFSWSATLMVKLWDGPKAVLNQHLFKVTSDEFPKWFYFMWTKHHVDEFVAIAESHATTFGHIKRGDLDEAMVLVPGPERLKEMTGVMDPLFEKHITNSAQIKSLTALRDTLLPKLMSGEVRVEMEHAQMQ
ncbi:MAG: restriction endonuclease subunit S, partial [Bacteroidetes bacterium]|nr:restriction endonuclease subunit S [Bacteroidota bacterium]